MLRNVLFPLLFFFSFLVNASFSLITDLLSVDFPFGQLFIVYTVLFFFACGVALRLNSVSAGFLFLLMALFCYLVLRSVDGDDGYGITKAFLGLAVPCLSVLIISFRNWSEGEVLRSILFTCLIVLVVALIYKAIFGFFQRSVRFGLFGSITFGWVMSFGALASLFSLKNKRSILVLVLLAGFLAALVWCGSKGPLISFFIVMLLMVAKEFNFVGILILSLSIILLAFLVGDLLLQSRAIGSLMVLIEDPQDYIANAGSGSVGSRIDFYIASLTLFFDNPIFGVGFGTWSEHTNSGHHFYPHNLLLEVSSEAGVVGLLLLISILIRVHFLKQAVLKYLSLLAVVVMMFSGDFSYIRYALFFILVGELVRRKRCFQSVAL